jgi:probable blue pigment (indigoidine) exporter
VVDLASRSRSMPLERRAIVAVLGAVVLWSCTSLFVRAGRTDAMVFLTWRLWLALPPLSLAVWLRSRRGAATPFFPPDVSRRRWALMLVGAGAFFVSGAGTAFSAIRMTRLLDVTLIASLQPVFIIAVAVAFLGEEVGRSHVARASLAIGGTVVVAAAASGAAGSWSLAGDFVAVLSLVLNGAWFLYGRVLRTSFVVDPFAFMLGTLSAAAVLLTPITLVVHGSAISGRGVFFAACTAIGGTSAHVLMIWAHRHVATSVSSPMLLVETPLVAAGAWVFFGEALTAVEGIGAAVVVASLWGVASAPELAEVEHDVPDPGPPA